MSPRSPRDFAAHYRTLYERLGYPLRSSHQATASSIDRAERRLGFPLPEALRAYYLVAGKEYRFNCAHNYLANLNDLELNAGHVAFVLENQAVCDWGFALHARTAGDPLLKQGVRQPGRIEWIPFPSKCCNFLSVMLHLQAAFGGYSFRGYSEVAQDLRQRLKKEWQFIGEADRLWAYARPNQVVCLFADSPSSANANLLHAGGKTRRDLQSIADSLQVTLR